MFYDTTSNNHDLPYNPLKGCIVPRPIGWITSMDQEGIVNLAPYSYFNAICDKPPMIMFSSSNKEHGQKKDTLRNIESTKEFVVNIATYGQRDFVNLSSSPLPHGMSEIERFKIETVPSTIVKPPRVKDSCIHLECRYVKTVDLDFDEHSTSSKMAIGHIVGVHIRDDLIVNGKVDLSSSQVIARLGYDEYTIIERIFKMSRPSDG